MATDQRERAIADSQFGGGATTWAPATWYLGLSTTIPNEDGSNFTEPTGGAYARVAVVNNTTNFPAAVTTSGVTTKQNGAAFTFPNPTANWGQILYYGWFTAATGGVPEYANALDTPVTVNNGNTPVQFATGQLVWAWD
jgi:hypothetical protein